MKNWWLLLVKFLVFALLFMLVDYGIGQLFVLAKDKALENHPSDIWLKSSYTVEKLQSECVIIGSSTVTHNYIPDEIEKRTGLSTYNCGQDGCFFLYSCCLINTILERYQPKVIVLDVNPYSLLNIDGSDEYQNMRYLSYYYDKDSVIRNYINSKSDRNKLLYYTNFYRYNSHFVYTFYPVLHSSPTIRGYVPLYSQEGHSVSKDLLKWEKGWNEYELQTLAQTLDNCKKKGTKVIVVTSPYYADYDFSVRKECDNFGSMLDECGVKYINLLYAAPFNSDSSLFRDVAHLNEKGATIVTDSLANVIVQLLNN